MQALFVWFDTAPAWLALLIGAAFMLAPFALSLFLRRRP